MKRGQHVARGQMRGHLKELLSEAEQVAGTMVAHNLILLIFAATPVFSFYWFNGNSTLSPKSFSQFDKIHLFSGPDIPTGVNNIDAAEPESEGGPGAEEEGALSNPGYSFFQQWVTGHGSGDEDDSMVTGNGPSSNPEQGSPAGDEDDDRPNLPSGDYCALDASHTMCKFEVADTSYNNNRSFETTIKCLASK